MGGYTSKYAQNEMSKTVNGNKDPKKKKNESRKRVTTHKAGGSGQATEAKEKRELKRSKHNSKVEKKKSKDLEQYKKTGNQKKYTRKSGRKSRTYRI